MGSPLRDRQSRIPLSLQAVFLASNRGKDVHKPPPEKAGNKVFFGNWFFQRNGNSKRKMKFFKNKNKTYCPEEKTSTSTVEDQKNSDCSSQAAGVERQTMQQHQQQEGKNIIENPHAYLDYMLHSRGYSTQRFKTLRTSYYNKPTPLQEASYDAYLIGLIRRKNVDQFTQVMSCGLSPNACNRFGESVVHMVCRHGNHKMLETLIQNGATLQVSDDYGRTPLHDACWAAKPAFETVQLILQQDVRQFHMIDARGDVPLKYVREEHWADWIDFLKTNADLYWPVITAKDEKQKAVPLPTFESLNAKQIPDPVNSLSCELAKMVACGRMSPEEARFLNSGDITDALSSDNDYDDEEEDDLSSFDSEDDDDDDSDYYSDDDDDVSRHSLDDDDDLDEIELLLAGLPSQFRGQ